MVRNDGQERAGGAGVEVANLRRFIPCFNKEDKE